MQENPITGNAVEGKSYNRKATGALLKKNLTTGGAVEGKSYNGKASDAPLKEHLEDKSYHSMASESQLNEFHERLVFRQSVLYRFGAKSRKAMRMAAIGFNM